MPVDVEKGHAFARSFAAGVRRAFGDNDVPDRVPAEFDAGLGVPTWRLELGRCRLAGCWFELDGSEARPHYFFSDRFLVISSSLPLSRRLLEAAKPGVVDFDEARSYRAVHSDPRHCAAAAVELRDLIQQIGRATDGLVVEAARAMTVLQGAESLLALLGDYRMRAWLDGREGFGRLLVEFR